MARCGSFNGGVSAARGDNSYAVSTGTVAISTKDDGTDGTPGSGYSDVKNEGTNAGC